MHILTDGIYPLGWRPGEEKLRPFETFQSKLG
jgi:hypothetical protein